MSDISNSMQDAWDNWQQDEMERKEREEIALDGGRLRRELDQLLNDPIILGMVKDMEEKSKAQFIRAVNPWNDLVRCGDEYIRRGGRNAETVGGPYKAILTILHRG